MNIAHWLERAGTAWPHLPALAIGDTPLYSYETLSARVRRLAGAMRRRLNLPPGARVALFMANAPEYVEILFACWHAGLAAVPVNAKLHERELGYILGHAGAALCFCDEAHHSAAATAIGDNACELICTGDKNYQTLFREEPIPMAETAAEDLAWLFYTSGTTGQPKGAMLTHRNLTIMTLNYFADFAPVSPGESLLHAAPMSHGSGLWILPHVCGGACSVIPESRRFDPEETFTLIGRWPQLSMFLAPTMLRRMVLAGNDGDVANLKLITYGGAPMYVEDCIRALERFGPCLSQLYGQGECPMSISHLPAAMIADRNHPDWRYRLGTAGLADSCVQIRIGDDEGTPLPPGEKGEILCRGDIVMAGYWQNPEATQRTIRNGWLHTGDIGHLDENGLLTLTDRAKDMIISGGSNIYPREVEEVLLTHPAVGEAAVIGTSHPDWGETVTAYVVAAQGAEISAASLDAHCLKHLARFKRPRIYRFINSLPKNNYGKVLKTTLREWAQDAGINART